MYKPSQVEKKQFAKMRLCIISPIMYPEPRWIKSMANMISYSWMNGLKIFEMGMCERMVVDWARNSLADSAFHKKSDYDGKHYTHFLWLDADHVFNPDLGICLARHFMKKEVDGVSALYYGRDGKPLPVCYVKADGEDEYKHYPIVIVPPTLIEVDAFGFGACMMKRSIFGTVPKPWFTVDWRAGEDIAFCKKAKQLGIRWFVDGAYKLGHIGEAHVIAGADYDKHMEENKELYADRVKINLGGV